MMETSSLTSPRIGATSRLLPKRPFAPFRPRTARPCASALAGVRPKTPIWGNNRSVSKLSPTALVPKHRAGVEAQDALAGKAEDNETNGAPIEDGLPEFSVLMEVRDSELDQYSVVNNAVYNTYLQHARHKLLEHIGCDADEVARSGDALALASINIKYLGPLRSRDTFAATVSVKKITGVRLVLSQKIRRTAGTDEHEGESVLEAEAVVVWLDQDYRPKRIPKEQIMKFRSFSESVQVRG